jgi:hypothetical protein
VIPASIPVLAELMGTSSATLLPVVPALFVGLFAGVALTPAASSRLPLTAVVAAGAVTQAVALALLAAATTPTAAIVAAGTAGLGFGLVESCGAALARLRSTSHTGLTLTQLTAVTAAIATLTPLAVVAGGTTTARLVLIGAALPHLLAASALSANRWGPGNSTGATPPTAGRGSARWTAVSLFCYVGSETIVAGWSAVLPQVGLDLTAADAAVGTSLFWLLLTLGRLTGAAVLARGADPQTVLLTCQLSCVGLLISSTVTADRPSVALTLLGAAVSVMGPCYALLLGIGLQTVDASGAARLSAVLVAVGALGGATWSAAAARGLDIRTIPAIACLAMALSAASAHRARSPGRSCGDRGRTPPPRPGEGGALS